MPTHDIIAIGASAGGIEPLAEIVRALPAELPASVFVVVHTPPDNPSALPEILQRASALRVAHARDGEPIEPGRVYVARPDHHLLVRPGCVRVMMGPRENGFRPSVDPLFRSAAVAYGPRVVGVVLSGSLDDGTAGLAVIAQAEGITIAQDPAEALYPGMPVSAIERVGVDHVVRAAELPALLSRLAREPVRDEGVQVSDENRTEADIAEMDQRAIEALQRPGTPAGFGCPECGGALYALPDGEVVHYRCRVGHAWSPDSLLAQQGAQLETALWTALRALEESAALRLQLARRLRRRGSESSAARFEAQASTGLRNAEVIRQVLVKGVGSEPAANAEPLNPALRMTATRGREGAGGG
jgi:two-component system chemotaxis response regulator CheB